MGDRDAVTCVLEWEMPTLRKCRRSSQRTAFRSLQEQLPWLLRLPHVTPTVQSETETSEPIVPNQCLRFHLSTIQDIDILVGIENQENTLNQELIEL